MPDLIAYLGKPELKEFLLTELVAHREAERLVQGQYWKDGKGCAVSCTLEAISHFNGNAARVTSFSKHSLYESELGIPQVVARLEDCIFEGLPLTLALEWPERFSNSIQTGADLTLIWPRFALWLLREELPQHTRRKQTKAALAEVAALYYEWTEGTKPSTQRWINARRNADANAAAAAAYAANANAADANAAAAAAYAANANAADANAAAAAAYAANANAAAARSAACADYWQRASNKLIELLISAPLSKRSQA